MCRSWWSTDAGWHDTDSLAIEQGGAAGRIEKTLRAEAEEHGNRL
jgi:hypothetical protein